MGMDTKPDPLGWCDCPSVNYYVGYMMCGHKVSHRLYHLIASKWPSLEIDIKLFGAKPVFIDRLELHGRGNSTFRYSAENPPPTYPSWIKRHLVWPYHKDDAAYKAMENFNKAKLSGGLCRLGCDCKICSGWEGHGKEFYKDYPEREPNGEPTYDAEVFRREMRLAFEVKRLQGITSALAPILPDYTKGCSEDTHDKECAKLPGEYRDLTPTLGWHLCPGRTYAWVRCMPKPEDDGWCCYCGGALRA